MKAYNSKKTPREHILFCYKQRKLSLSQAKEYETADGKKEKYVETGIFKVTGRKDKVVIHGDWFKIHACLQETYSDYWERIKDKDEKERLADWENDNRLTYWSCKRFKNTQEVLDWIIDKYYK